MIVDDQYLGKQRVHIMPDTLIGMPTSGEKRPFKYIALQLYSGQSVEVIGWRMRNGVDFAADVLVNS